MDAGAGHLAEGMSITMKFLSEDNETQSINNLPLSLPGTKATSGQRGGQMGIRSFRLPSPKGANT
jgi:hypothetical protein